MKNKKTTMLANYALMSDTQTHEQKYGQRTCSAGLGMCADS